MVSVRVSSLCATVVVLAMAAAARADDVPSYAVPAVDFTQLYASAGALLDAMQHDGIVALKNIPEYAALRSEYLSKAAACAVHAKDHGAEFLLHRRLQDGTQRYTISTESGRRLDASGFETVESCPGYQEVYHKFSRVVETAVASVGRALDASKALQVARRQLYKAPTTMTARELMAESVHLDHFHAYEASRSLSATQKGAEDLSLEMHTDNGLMIAMTAPEYFNVQGTGEVVSRHTRSENAGLLIKTADGKTVRPQLQADELVLMLGEGINTWIHTTPKLHAVTHGMQYPRGLSYADADVSHKSLRAWFGKMILLSEDHVMANTGLTYGEFANQTTRYLNSAADSADLGFAAVACSPNRRLQASDNKCELKTGCTLRADGDATAMADSCQITCNHKATSDQALCEKNCQCDDATDTGATCWMLCVPLLSTEECTGDQKCNTAYKKAEIAMTCAAGSTPTTTTPAPTTTAPSTPAPTTKAPTTAPTTTVPSSSQSSSSSESTSGSTSSPAPTEAAETTESSDEMDSSTAGSVEEAANVVASNTTKPTSTPTPTSGSVAVLPTAVAAGAVALISSLHI